MYRYIHLQVKYNKSNLLTDEMRRVYGDETASKLGKSVQT